MSPLALHLAGDALTIDPNQVTSLGKFGSAGFGVVSLYFSLKQAGNTGLLYTKVDRSKHDWLSLGLGLLAGTSLAQGIDTIWGLPQKFLNGLFTGLEHVQIVADIGLAGVAFLILIKLSYGDYKQTTLVWWGFVLAALLPLSGGVLTIPPSIAGYLATQITTGFTG